MSIKSLYRDYVQKSRIFLYPALNIKRGHSVTPIQTYTSWDGVYRPEDRMLICLYHMRTDEEYRQFEKTKLMGNPMFCDFRLTDDDKGVYIFDFSSLSTDWDNFLKGRYSKLSADLKRKIRSFYGTNNLGYIDSFLYPERYLKLYSELLTCRREDVPAMLKTLKDVGELCSIPDLEQENLIANMKNLHIPRKSI